MKWTIVICQFGYLAFIAANLYAKPALMYPASILLGLAGAPLWTSESSYVTQIGIIHAESKGKKSETGVTLFFGIFFAIFQTSKLTNPINILIFLFFKGQIWGNMISYLVLSPTNKPGDNTEVSVRKTLTNNVSNTTNNKYQCGAHFFDKEYSATSTSVVPTNLV